jgi:two-component system, OmpR family, response regulator RstA
LNSPPGLRTSTNSAIRTAAGPAKGEDAGDPVPSCRALLVCESGHRALALRGFLRQQGFVVRMDDGKRIIDTCLSVKPDFIVIDLVHLANEDFHCCRQLRGMFGLPLILIAARTTSVDQALALESGADDIVARDTDPQVLAARIAALLRRYRADGLNPVRRQLRLNSLSLDPGSFCAELDGRDLGLSNGEFDLLWLLASLRGTVVTKDMLSNATRCMPGENRERCIDMFIYRLRQKIQRGGGDPKMIRTVRARGFMLVA